MNLETICQQLHHYKVDSETEEFEITLFFDKVGEEIHKLGTLNDTQKEKLIQALFTCIQNQYPEMEENFSFIHLIENIDAPDYKIYDAELVNFTKEHGTITSTLLLNRHINSLDKTERTECINLLQAIAENDNFTKYIREEALNYYHNQKAKLLQ